MSTRTTDETNKRNVMMLFAYIGMALLCIMAFLIIIAIAGTSNVNPNIGSLDRPIASVSHYDHRL